MSVPLRLANLPPAIERAAAKTSGDVEQSGEALATAEPTGVDSNIEDDLGNKNIAKTIANQPPPEASAKPAVALQPVLTPPPIVNSGAASALKVPQETVNAKSGATTARQTGSSNAASAARQQDVRKSPSRGQISADSSSVDIVQLSAAGHQAMAAAADGKAQDNPQSAAKSEEPNGSKTSAANSVDAPSSAGNPNSVSGELAIAMRISSAASDTNAAQSPAETTPAIAASSAIGLHGQAQSGATTGVGQPHEPPAAQPMAAPTAAQTSNSSQAAGADKMEEATGTHATDFETEFNKALSEPVRGAHVQITGADDQRVDIRLQERAGVMSVTVRSDDASLTKALQDHTPELTARLSTEHFQTDLWTPGSSKTPQQFTNNQGGSSQHQQGAGSGGQQQSNQRQNSKQNQHPEWIDEFENNPTAFNKRIEYTWPQ